MSPYFATHAGLLSYVARDLSDCARSADRDSAQARKLELYAAILDRMIAELSAPTRAS
jgi:hypothetical protein